MKDRKKEKEREREKERNEEKYIKDADFILWRFKFRISYYLLRDRKKRERRKRKKVVDYVKHIARIIIRDCM